MDSPTMVCTIRIRFDIVYKQSIKMKNKKIIIISVLALLAVAVGLLLYSVSDSKLSREQIDKKNDAPNTTNLSPPTEQDAQRADDNKQRIVDEKAQQEAQATQQTGTKKNIQPIITYAGLYGGSVEVGGYVNVFEEGGACTATFINGSKRLAKTVDAVRDAKATNCPTISFSVNEFSPRGNYTLTLSYSSASTSGTSDPRQIEVQ